MSNQGRQKATCRSTTVSCPGKVLIAGGYLVLEPENGGLVVATASRFYTVVRDAPAVASVSNGAAARSSKNVRIKVNSPQFVEATWIYAARLEHGNSLQLSQVQDGAPKNGFVQDALEAALKVSTALGNPPTCNLMIDIVGDNDFYSQDRSLQSSNPNNPLSKEPPAFAHLNTSISKVHKTGLGSSAAMVTSLVAGLLLHLSGSTEHVLDARTLDLYHNVAQYAHSRAQGKVGSGFDVSSAIFGSQVYHRFSTECLQQLLDEKDPSPAKLLLGLSPSFPLWQRGSSTGGRVEPFSLPPMTTMLLADVDAGSNTPSMVKSVLKWKSSDTGSNIIWQKIGNANNQLGEIFRQLRHEAANNREEYIECIKVLASLPNSEWTASDKPTQRLFYEARDTIKVIRHSMKAMGIAADVPIEPDEQTYLLDYCAAKCNGLLGGGVPGAGGYDAIWLIVLDPNAIEGNQISDESPAESKIRQIWSDWASMSVKALSSKAKITTGFPDSSDQAAGRQASGLRTHALQEVHRLEDVLQKVAIDF